MIVYYLEKFWPSGALNAGGKLSFFGCGYYSLTFYNEQITAAKKIKCLDIIKHSR